MAKTMNSGGFCSCKTPTEDRDNSNVKYCKRCNLDIVEVIDLDERMKQHNLASLEEAKQDVLSDIELQANVKCPFCYVTSAWGYPSGDDGENEDEAYCGDCDIAFKIATGAFVAGSGDPVTIKAKHNKPASGGAEDKSVQIIKNGEAPKEPEIEKHYCRMADKVPGQQSMLITCDFCPATFSGWTDAIKHETVDANGNPKGSHSSGNNNYSYNGYSSCTHTPVHILDGGKEGWNIWAGNKWGCSNKLKEYDIVLNLTGDSAFRSHVIPIPSLAKFQTKNTKPIEVVLDWPDMGVLGMGRDWWDAFAAHVKKSKSKVVMFCMGGHGRTGTAMAVLMVVMLKWTAKESIAWVKENYCKKAIETVSQMEYVYQMAGEPIPDNLKARKGNGFGSVRSLKEAITAVGGADDTGPNTGTTALI